MRRAERVPKRAVVQALAETRREAGWRLRGCKIPFRRREHRGGRISLCRGRVSDREMRAVAEGRRAAPSLEAETMLVRLRDERPSFRRGELCCKEKAVQKYLSRLNLWSEQRSRSLRDLEGEKRSRKSRLLCVRNAHCWRGHKRGRCRMYRKDLRMQRKDVRMQRKDLRTQRDGRRGRFVRMDGWLAAVWIGFVRYLPKGLVGQQDHRARCRVGLRQRKQRKQPRLCWKQRKLRRLR